MASVIRIAKIFRNGGSRAIRLPKEFELSGDEVVLKQDFGVITIMPKRPRAGSLLDMLKAIGPIELGSRDQPGWTDKRADPALKISAKVARPSARKR
jgi:antitoxin VapB